MRLLVQLHSTNFVGYNIAFAQGVQVKKNPHPGYEIGPIYTRDGSVYDELGQRTIARPIICPLCINTGKQTIIHPDELSR